MKNRDFWLLMTILLGILLIAVFSGCYTEKKAIKQVDKAIVVYPVPASQEFRRFFPITTTGKSFSTDSAAYKESLDSLYSTRGWYETLIRGLETLPAHPVAQDTLCPELAKELIQANKKIDYQEQYIISMTDDFNHIQPVIINRVDTILDKSVAMEWEYKNQQLEKRLTASQDETAQKEKSKEKWFAWTVRLGVSSIILLLLLIAAIWLLIQKQKAKVL